MKIKPRARALLAATALALASVAAIVPGAQAATRGAATPAVPALHGTRIALGATTDLFANAFAEAPNGTVFFSRGAVVYVVAGNRAPVIKLHAGRPVLALAATNADLFVETGLLVTEYNRGNNRQVRHWTLTSPIRAITSAGLYVVGDTVWVWTDWATDGSGFEYAEISRMHTTSAAVRVVSKSGFPGDMSADAAGLYFETVHNEADDLGHANPTTSGVQYRSAPIDAPIALFAGRVDLLAFGDSAAVDSYNATNLALVSSKRIPERDDSIEGTALGLLVLAQPCNAFPCKSATVGRLNVATGATSGALATPGAYQQLNGPAQAVVEAGSVSGTHASLFLVRISS
jgi:hypothetical protein